MGAEELLEAQDVKGFFQETLVDLIDQRKMEVGEDTVAYVANLLTNFVRSDRFYEWTPQGPTLTPLAMLYAEVLRATSLQHRQQMLRRLGDVALFVAGVFTESFQRKSYDVDYYIGMGGAAYGSLSECAGGGVRGGVNAQMFAELSTCFADFVQVLARICEHADVQNDRDILKLYELWVRTGSRHAADKLRAVGIDVVSQGNGTWH